MKKHTFLLLAYLLFTSVLAKAQIITTIAGGGSAINDGMPATSAKLNNPIGVVVDNAGNVYVGDRDNHRVRKISKAGIITTIAGTGDPGFDGDGGPATAAHINRPYNLAIDTAGNIYIADVGNNRIRKINSSGIITTIVGSATPGYSGDKGPATSALVNSPTGIVTDATGNIYFTDALNNRIRKISSSGIITTIAGVGTPGHIGDDGAATTAQLNIPYGIAMDATGNIYIAEDKGNCIRKINTAGIISTVAGTGVAGDSGDGGPATVAQLNRSMGVCVDNNSNIYIADYLNCRIRKIDAAGIIKTFVGTMFGFSGDGGPANMAQLNIPTSVAVDAAGSLYIADFGNSRIRYVRNAMAIDEVQIVGESLSVYPNPCQGKFRVDFLSQTNEQVAITIIDVTGKNIANISTFTNIATEINISVLPGVYLLTANTTDKSVSKYLVVTK